MIIITDRPERVTEWVEQNCAAPSRFAVAEASPRKIELHLTETDQMLFDIMFAGWFVRNPRNYLWHDDTPLNRLMISFETLERSARDNQL